MAEELRDSLGVESKLVPGSGGIFEVVADGRNIFDKKSTGRFPKQGEVTKALSK